MLTIKDIGNSVKKGNIYILSYSNIWVTTYGVRLSMTTKRVNFNLDEDLYIELKHLALDKRKTITEFLTDLIIRELEEDTNQTKLEME